VIEPDRIKPFLLHADDDVRQLATSYFGDIRSEDPGLLPLVLDACELYGLERQRSMLHTASDFVIDDASVGRLLALMDAEGPGRSLEVLNELLVAAPGEVLRGRADLL
jgi:hypothetical protein